MIMTKLSFDLFELLLRVRQEGLLGVYLEDGVPGRKEGSEYPVFCAVLKNEN